MSPTKFATPKERDKADPSNVYRTVTPSPQNILDDNGGGFWIDCIGRLQDNIPDLCGESSRKIEDSPPPIVEVDVTVDPPSKLSGFKASLKRVGSFRRAVSHEDISSCSSSSAESQNSHSSFCSQYSLRRLRQRRQKPSKANNNNNRDTRDLSPSVDNDHHKRSLDEGDGSREIDSPQLVDPPSTRKRSRPIPLDKLLHSRKDRGVKTNNNNNTSAQPSPPIGIVLRSSSPNLTNAEKMKIDVYSKRHDDVVTALIDDALQNVSDDFSVSTIEPKRTFLYSSPIRQKLQGGILGSPNRKKITTPQWMRSRSRKADEDESVCSVTSSLSFCTLTSNRSISSRLSRVSSVNAVDFFHSKCNLVKAKGTMKDSSQMTPSAVGRDATFAKLMQKLSILSEIESGKYGKGADMLRSDAVAFILQGYIGVDAVETRSILTVRMGFVSMNYGVVLHWDCASKLVKQVILVKMCRDDFLDRHQIGIFNSGNTILTESEIDEDCSTITSVDSRTDHSPGRAHLNPSTDDGQAYLSVSILNVKKLVPQCDRHNNDYRWPWSKTSTAVDAKKKKKPDHSNIRPYVRFVFGRNQHLTKSAKFNKGNITWSKRQRNSCLLPCPPEDQRWFVGQEDLVVEVRSRQKPSSAIKSLFKSGTSPQQKHNPTDDPLLAAVTVPLSSIIFDEEDDNNTLDGKTRSAMSNVARFFKKNSSETKDEPPSTYITLPLPMKCCSKAPFGSISLRITMKTPASQRRTTSLTAPAVYHHPPRKRSPRPKSVVSHQHVEGIELLPLTSLISSWVNDDAETNTKHKNIAMSKVMTWTKRYDPRTKKWANVKWSNVNGSIKRSRSVRKSTKKNKKAADKPIILQVVDQVMGKEEEKGHLDRFGLKPASDAIHQAGDQLNRSVHKVRDDVMERKKIAEARAREVRKAVERNMNDRRQRSRASAANRIAKRR